MNKFLENIAKIRNRCEESNLNHCSMDITIVDRLWWFKTDSTLKFDHWTGVDSEEFEEDKFCDNKYIQENISNNIVDILNQIDRKTYIKKQNSIVGR